MKYIIEIEEKPLCVFDKDTQTYFPRLWRVKGFNSLVFDEEGLSRLEELNADYINEHFSDLQDTAYQKGLEEGKALSERGCEGCEYQVNRELTCPCSECANNYKNYWTKEEFVRGDVVVDENGTRGIVVSSENNESNLLYVLFKGYRVPQSVVRKHYKKTGEHYDIDKFLDEIKGDSNK